MPSSLGDAFRAAPDRPLTFLIGAKHTETILYYLLSIFLPLPSRKNQYMIKKEAIQIKQGSSPSPIIKTEQQKR